jgi:Arc/MetJ-type ribon-helix-helix transcriptional regulator
MPNMRTHVVLPGDLVAAIDHLVGKRGRSSFLKQAAWEEVKRQRLLRLLEKPEPIWKAEDHPELKDGAGAWVGKMRAEDERLDRRRNRR